MHTELSIPVRGGPNPHTARSFLAANFWIFALGPVSVRLSWRRLKESGPLPVNAAPYESGPAPPPYCATSTRAGASVLINLAGEEGLVPVCPVSARPSYDAWRKRAWGPSGRLALADGPGVMRVSFSQILRDSQVVVSQR
jgi:hypothetical protein